MIRIPITTFVSIGIPFGTSASFLLVSSFTTTGHSQLRSSSQILLSPQSKLAVSKYSNFDESPSLESCSILLSSIPPSRNPAKSLAHCYSHQDHPIYARCYPMQLLVRIEIGGRVCRVYGQSNSVHNDSLWFGGGWRICVRHGDFEGYWRVRKWRNQSFFPIIGFQGICS